MSGAPVSNADAAREVSRRINAERLVLTGWSRAILLQVAHPLVAAGVARHSGFRDSPVASARRLHHTVRAMLGLTFGTPDEHGRVIQGILAIHRRVNGTLTDRVGIFPAGTRYSAEDPTLVLWVHATLIDSTLLAYDTLVDRLRPADRDAYCLAAADVAVELGADSTDVPRDWAGLGHYLQAMYASDTLHVGPEAREVATALLAGSFATLTGPVGWANRLMTAGWLPAAVRAQYGMGWDDRRERQFRRLLSALGRLRRITPRRLACFRSPQLRP